MKETLKERKIYRILTDVGTKAWDKIAFWTTAKSVDAEDGRNLQTKVGAINGITSDINGESDNIAASIKCVKQLNNKFGGMRFGVDGDGNYGYYGADDSLIPFKSGNGGLIAYSTRLMTDFLTSEIVQLEDRFLLDKDNFSVASNKLTCLKDNIDVHILKYGSGSGYYNVHYEPISVKVYKNNVVIPDNTMGHSNVITLNKGDTIHATSSRSDGKSAGSYVFFMVHA